MDKTYWLRDEETQKDIGPYSLGDLNSMSIRSDRYVLDKNLDDWVFFSDLLKSVKKYHLENAGPLTLEELIQRKITRETLVWVTGDKNNPHVPASSLKELDDYFAKLPPPFPKKGVVESAKQGLSDLKNDIEGLINPTQQKTHSETNRQTSPPPLPRQQDSGESGLMKYLYWGLLALFCLTLSIKLRGYWTGDIDLGERYGKKAASSFFRWGCAGKLGTAAAGLQLWSESEWPELKVRAEELRADKESFWYSIDRDIVIEEAESAFKRQCSESCDSCWQYPLGDLLKQLPAR